MLTWATQTYGFLTEYFARPKAYVDEESPDRSALALLSQTEWSSGRPLFDARNPQQPVDVEPVARATGAWGAWARRLVPHIFGWFTMTTVWVILVVQLEHAKRDIDKIPDRNIPEWVNALVRRIDPPLHPPSETKRHLVVACSNRSTARLQSSRSLLEQ